MGRGASITVNIPYPPTANNLFQNGARGRVKTQTYRNWIADAGWVVNAQRPGRIEGPYVLTLTATRPDRRRRDVENLAKPVSDLLVHLGIVQDDHLAQRIILEWSPDEPDPGAMVSVKLEAATSQAITGEA